MSKKTVFFDANILYSWNLNHLLMFFCDTGVSLIEPYWSGEVIEEAIRNIKTNTGDDAAPRFEQMNKIHPYANVTGYAEMPDVEGVDPKDQHAAKAAIHNECDFLVTNNLKHFKKASALQKSPKALTPDSLLTALATKYSAESLKATALAWWHKRAAGSFDEYLAYLEKTDGIRLTNFIKGLKEQIAAQDPKAIAAEILKNETRRY